MTFLFWIDKFF